MFSIDVSMPIGNFPAVEIIAFVSLITCTVFGVFNYLKVGLIPKIRVASISKRRCFRFQIPQSPRELVPLLA